MNLVHEQVEHRQFGVGDIIEQTQTMITVRFAGEGGVKKFLCPSAFEVFLTLRNPALRADMDDAFQRVRDQQASERRAIEEEHAAHLAEARLALIAQKRAAKKPPAKRAPAKAKKPAAEKAPPEEPTAEK